MLLRDEMHGYIVYLGILAIESSTYSYQYLKTAKMHATFGASEPMQATCVSSVTFRGFGEYCMACCAAWSSYKDHCIDYSHSQGFIQAFSLATSSHRSCTTRTAHLVGDPPRSPSPTYATVKICKQHCNREQIDSTLISHMWPANDIAAYTILAFEPALHQWSTDDLIIFAKYILRPVHYGI